MRAYRQGQQNTCKQSSLMHMRLACRRQGAVRQAEKTNGSTRASLTILYADGKR